MALAHAQFETIHPFTDGNGRTGRALVQAMLRASAITQRLTVPVSAGLLSEVEGYYEALTAYRSGDLDPIVTAFSHAAFAAIDNGEVLVPANNFRRNRVWVAWEVVDALDDFAERAGST